MNKRIIGALLSLTMIASVCSGLALTTASAAEGDYSTKRVMEQLDRGLIAVKTTANSANGVKGGVYLSWRLLGTESLTNQAFDIYKNNELLTTTAADGATSYIDESGTAADEYKVVKAGASASAETPVKATMQNYTASDSNVSNGNSHPNSFTYMDVPIERPASVARMGDGKMSHYYSGEKEGGANDASVGDLDGDGEYEIVLKWDPIDSKDSAGADFTGNVYIDAYEINPEEQAKDIAGNPKGEKYKWRIDLGKNVTAGAHYTQFMVYDFDSDGRAEIAMKTAPGTVDGVGNYVTEVGDTEEIRSIDNTKSYIGTSGRLKGKNPFTQFLTVFDGEDGHAIATTEYIPYEGQGYWGDPSAKYNRSERYLAAVAYIDGVTPSIVMCRGYYNNAVVRTYTFDGDTITLQAEHNANSRKDDNIFGQGNHNLSVADIDNDGKDEIVYGSASLDFEVDANGNVTSTKAVGNTKLGHGDAMHVNDFDNDGVQEVFSVKEDGEGYKKFAMDLRKANTGAHAWNSGVHVTGGDNGRGVMDNIDDTYASTHPDALAIGWSSGFTYAVDTKGNKLGDKPSSAGKGSFDNFLVYWDGDLGRELLDANIIQKYDAANGWTKRFYGPTDGYTLVGGTTNNYTKRTPSLVADIWGDWREEIIMPVGKGENDTPALRIYTSTIPTEYRLTTLMHDCQYRESVAWQNVAYNQPTHTSYYIGSAALAEGKKYLAPAVPFTEVEYPDLSNMVHVEGIALSDNNITIERTHSQKVATEITPVDAKKKGINWVSSNPSVATVSNGVIKAIAPGTATITATSKDTGADPENPVLHTDTCEVTVWSNAVTGVEISETEVTVAEGGSKTLAATVSAADPQKPASEQTLLWTSSNESIATVSSDGIVKGLMAGVATITATTTDGGFKSECTLNVVPTVEVDITDDTVFTTGDDPSYITNATATGAKLEQRDAPAGGEMHRDFEVLTENKALLTFKFQTGGVANINGAKEDGSNNWNWDGHEYTMNLAFLDENGDNILTVAQPYKTSAVDLISKVGNNAEENLISAWETISDLMGVVQGSAKSWVVEMEFDYSSNTCIATITGSDVKNGVTRIGKYRTNFDLEGAHFKTLKCYTTKDGEGTITATPTISDIVYQKAVPVTGETTELYVRGAKTSTPWSSSDVSDWSTTGTSSSIQLGIDNTHGLWFNPNEPGSSYSAKKTFTGINSDPTVNATLTYNIDWYFGNATNRSVNREYLQIGSGLRLAWISDKDGKSPYCVILSKNGGSSYEGFDSSAATMDSNKAVMVGSNTTYTKNVQAVIDVKTKTVTSLEFGGNKVDLGSEPYIMNTIDSVTFGFERGGKPEKYDYPNGITNITVSQFVSDVPMYTPPTKTPTVQETTAPVITTPPIVKTPIPTAKPTPKPSGELKITSANGKEAVASYKLADYTGSEVYVIGALYDGDKLVEIKADRITNPQNGVKATANFTFTNDIGNYKLKAFMWNSLSGMEAVCKSALYTPAAAGVVFTSSEDFLMQDSPTNKWIISSDGTIASEGTATAAEATLDGNKVLKLENKAVQYVLDEAITEGSFKLTYDMQVDKTSASDYGRYFRVYLDNAAHPFDASTGKATDSGNMNAFFHMMDYSDALYVTKTEALIAATDKNSEALAGVDAIKLSETTLEGGKWYRVVIDGNLDDGTVEVSYYAHGNSYNEDIDVSALTPVITNTAAFTAGRNRELKQIKFMRTSSGVLYFDNITLETGA